MINKVERINQVNKLITYISSIGRRFFNDDYKVSCMFLKNGRVWFYDSYSGKNIYTHYSGRWRGFTHGGTMRNLIIEFKNYIMTGNKINPNYFGPFPEWMCGGDLWGYGKENMELIRNKAIELEVCHG